MDSNKDPSYDHQIGVCYYWKEEYDQAILFLKKALEIDKNYHQSMNHLGLCYYYKCDYNEAEQWYLKALKISPKHKLYLWNIGRNRYWNYEY